MILFKHKHKMSHFVIVIFQTMTFPGFNKKELTDLPHGLEAPQILNRVTKAQDFNVSNEYPSNNVKCFMVILKPTGLHEGLFYSSIILHSYWIYMHHPRRIKTKQNNRKLYSFSKGYQPERNYINEKRCTGERGMCKRDERNSECYEFGSHDPWYDPCLS